tara:strand:+ start:3283 stop:3534 length:252 start_codon:yes stop_codon:yes gene_type:complete
MNFFRSKSKDKQKEVKKVEEKDVTIKNFLNQQKDNFNECVICLQEMKTNEELSIIVCSHIYHTECIQAWAKKKRLCPLCDYSF